MTADEEPFEIVMEEMVMEEMVMEEMVMEEMVVEEMVMDDSYWQRGSELALTRPDVPMVRAEEGLHCFWEEDTGLEVLLVQVGGFSSFYACQICLIEGHRNCF